MHIEHDAMSFMSGDDVLQDRALFMFDIRATRAHVHGLAAIGRISHEQSREVDEALMQLSADYQDGSFVLDHRYEDGHSAIEAYLIERLGEAGKRVHLGRSRNDQIAVALRLYMLDALDRTRDACVSIARSAMNVAREHERSPMPGYTHLQRAVPSTVGLWMASFAEGFIECAHLCQLSRDWLDASPLGTAAGYGVNLPLPRQQVADELGFGRVQINPMASQSMRGRAEHQVLATLWQPMQEVRRFAWDCSLFSSQEFGFITLASGYVTGSSIMPNKRNPDMAELLRASIATVSGAMAEIQQVMSLPSGYHRDLQITKPALLRGVKVTLGALAHIPRMIDTITLHTASMREAIDPAMLATDHAVTLAASGMPFRDAYAQTVEAVGNMSAGDENIDRSIAARVSPGGCANLMLDDIESRIHQLGDGALDDSHAR